MIGAAIAGFRALSLVGKTSAILSIVLTGVVIFLLLTKNATISELRRSIDDPKTGYKVKLQQAEANLAVCRGNVAVLSGSLDRQNAGIKAVADAAQANAAIGRAELARVRLETKPLEVKVKQITADKPQSSDLCAEADRVLLGATK